MSANSDRVFNEVVCVTLVVAFWGGAAYIAWHFISKFW